MLVVYGSNYYGCYGYRCKGPIEMSICDELIFKQDTAHVPKNGEVNPPIAINLLIAFFYLLHYNIPAQKTEST